MADDTRDAAGRRTAQAADHRPEGDRNRLRAGEGLRYCRKTERKVQSRDVVGARRAAVRRPRRRPMPSPDERPATGGRFGSLRRHAAAGVDGRLIAASAVGAAAMLVVFLVILASGALAPRDDVVTLLPRLAQLEAQTREAANRPQQQARPARAGGSRARASAQPSRRCGGSLTSRRGWRVPSRAAPRWASSTRGSPRPSRASRG